MSKETFRHLSFVYFLMAAMVLFIIATLRYSNGSYIWGTIDVITGSFMSWKAATTIQGAK